VASLTSRANGAAALGSQLSPLCLIPNPLVQERLRLLHLWMQSNNPGHGFLDDQALQLLSSQVDRQASLVNPVVSGPSCWQKI